jgi:hypothetical protein
MATTWYYNSSNNDWRVTQLATTASTALNIWTTSPCDVNYHVPTADEFQTAFNTFPNVNYGNVANLPTILKMPYAGYRNYTNGLFSGAMYGAYWSSSPYWGNVNSLSFNSSTVNPSGNVVRAFGYPVRCIKN